MTARTDGSSAVARSEEGGGGLVVSKELNKLLGPHVSWSVVMETEGGGEDEGRHGGL